jgi:hypothetical protein
MEMERERDRERGIRVERVTTNYKERGACLLLRALTHQHLALFTGLACCCHSAGGVVADGVVSAGEFGDSTLSV